MFGSCRPTASYSTAEGGAVPGFGIRRQRSAAVAYIVVFRTVEGQSCRYAIGRHGAPWTPDKARAKAEVNLAEAAIGADPAATKQEQRDTPTVEDLCERYLAAAHAGRLPTRRGGTKKASLLAADKSRIDCHVLPLLGKLRASTVTMADLEVFMHNVSDGRTHRREKLAKARAP